MIVTVEDMLLQMDRNNKEIARLTVENTQLSKDIQNYNDEEYITISRACKKYDVSYPYLYRLISNGEIKNYSKGKRILLKTEEVRELLINI